MSENPTSADPIEETSERRLQWLQNVQGVISLGYLYLLMLGLLNQAVFYGSVGISIITYSSVVDILLSPLVVMVSKPQLLLAVVVVVALTAILNVFLKRRARRQLSGELNEKSRAKIEKSITMASYLQWLLPAWVVLFAFVGFAVGSSNRMGERLADEKFHPTHLVTYADGQTSEVLLVGQTSQFLFATTKAQGPVGVIPFSEHVLRLEPVEPVDED